MKGKIISYSRRYGFKPILTFSTILIIAIICIYFVMPENTDPSKPSPFLSINLTGCLTSLAAYIGLVSGYYTITTNRLSAREKNALDIQNSFSNEEVRSAIGVIHKLRLRYLNNDKTLNRKNAARHMRVIANFKDKNKILSYDEVTDLEQKEPKCKKLRDHYKAVENNKIRQALGIALNKIELCANGIRYNIYDEILIYNVLGSQIIDIYEVAYQYIKERQNYSPSLYVNLEWLAVKWNLEKKIRQTNSGRSSLREEHTSEVIRKANHELSTHQHCCRKKQLRKVHTELSRYRYPG